MSRVLITGAGGLLGTELVPVLVGKAPSARHVFALDRQALDVTDRSSVAACMRTVRPDIVIHAAAFTNVDGAEREAGAALRINGMGTMHVAAAAEEVRAKLVYLSTDYVFDGEKRSPYVESDRPDPLNVYGWSKLIGERLADAYCSRTFIVRTSWVYGKNGPNFVQRVIRQADRGEQMRIVDDQIGSPTNAADLARFIAALMRTRGYGTYHAAGRGVCSWYEFARTILELGGRPDLIVPCRSREFLADAERPVYSALGSERTAEDSQLPVMRDWKSALEEYMSMYRVKEPGNAMLRRKS